MMVEPPAALVSLAVPPAPTLRAEPNDAEAERARTWERLMRQRRPVERLMEKSIGRVLFAARSEVLRKIEATARKAAGAPVQKDDDKKEPDTQPHPGKAADLLFDQSAFRADLVAAVEKIARHAIQTAGDEVRDELGITDPWIAPPSTVINALRERESLISGAADEVFDAIKAELEAGFTAGDSTAELAARIRGTFNGISQDRAENIAVTETGAAYSTGRHASATATGCKTKTGLSARDKRVRPDHVEADGQTVGAEGLFTVGGEQTPYPCGPSLSAAQACRCRCMVAYQVGKL